MQDAKNSYNIELKKSLADYLKQVKNVNLENTDSQIHIQKGSSLQCFAIALKSLKMSRKIAAMF